MNLLAHRFRSFRSRLVVVFVGLFAVIQVAGFLAVAASVRASARSEIGEELRIASTLFTRQLDVRTEQLAAATRLVAGDFAPPPRGGRAPPAGPPAPPRPPRRAPPPTTPPLARCWRTTGAGSAATC